MGYHPCLWSPRKHRTSIRTNRRFHEHKWAFRISRWQKIATQLCTVTARIAKRCRCLEFDFDRALRHCRSSIFWLRRSGDHKILIFKHGILEPSDHCSWLFWLVVYLPLWKMMEFVKWEYYSQLNGQIRAMFQTTNQIYIYIYVYTVYMYISLVGWFTHEK